MDRLDILEILKSKKEFYHLKNLYYLVQPLMIQIKKIVK